MFTRLLRSDRCPALPGLVLIAVLLLGVPVAAGDWPQWRGPHRTGVSSDALKLESLPSELKVKWRLTIGGGFSSPVIAINKLVYLDAQGSQEVAHLIDALSSKELWQTPLGPLYQDEWSQGPRSTPIIDGDRVYAQSCTGEFRCLDLASGKVLWGVSFEKDFGVKFLGSKAGEGTASRRGNNGCGIVDGDRIYLPVGSTAGASLVAFDKANGKVLWKSGDDEAAYSALMLADFGGVHQVIYFSADALLGIAAKDGGILWRVPLRTNAKRHAATPIIFDDKVVVNSHTIGLLCFQIKRDGNVFKAIPAWANKQLKINLSTPALVDKYLYTHGANREFVCVDSSNGKTLWSHEGFGDKYNPVIAVGKKLLVMTDTGELVLLAANPEKYEELGRVQICGKTWNHPALANGMLYVREGLNSGWKLSCFELPNSPRLD